MFYTYTIRSKKDNKWYTGYTKDLRKRFQEHNDNKVFSTKGRGPFELIYYEACINEEDAKLREKYLKSGMGKRYLKNRLKRFLSLTGFTLIETIIVLAIITMFFAVSIPLFSRFAQTTKLDTSARSIASALRTARSYAISYNRDYYVVFDTTVTPNEYFPSSNAVDPIEKRYRLSPGVWFCNPSAPTGDPIADAIEFTGDIACFRPAGELDGTASRSVFIADGNDADAEHAREISVERTTGRVRIED